MKRCPYCDEKIQNNAKKCKHCGEWLTEVETGKLVECKKTYNPIVSFFRFILFIVACITFSYLSFGLIGLLLLLFAQLDTLRLIIGIFVFSSLFIGIWGILFAGLTILINKMFLLPVNKKLGRIFFRIIFILATIDKISGLRFFQVEYSNTFRAIFTIILLGCCIGFNIGLNEICEEE